MNPDHCMNEPRAIEAARTGHWPEGLEAHVRECSECTVAVRVTEWMAGVAAQLGRHRAAPDPTYIMLRADLERHANETPASKRGLGAVALLGLTFALAVAAVALTVWPTVSASLRIWLPAAWSAASLVDVSVIASTWVGLPLLLAATYWLVLRPLR